MPSDDRHDGSAQPTGGPTTPERSEPPAPERSLWQHHREMADELDPASGRSLGAAPGDPSTVTGTGAGGGGGGGGPRWPGTRPAPIASPAAVPANVPPPQDASGPAWTLVQPDEIGTPPPPGLRRTGLRRFRRGWRIAYRTTLAIAVASILACVYALTHDLDAPPGGWVYSGHITEVTQDGADRVAVIQGHGGGASSARVTLADDIHLHVGQNVSLAVTSDRRAIEVGDDPLWVGPIAMIAIVATLAWLVQVPRAAGRLEVALALRRRPLVLTDARTSALTAADRARQINHMMFRGLLLGRKDYAAVLVSDRPQPTRSVVFTDGVPILRGQRIYLPKGARHPKAALTDDGYVVGMATPDRRLPKQPRTA